MLASLHIRHYVLIDSLDIDFPEGLVIITGQTGAGKSILLGALSLALGAKADPGVISEGADSCVVEAEFRVQDNLRELLESNDVEWNGGFLTVRRTVHASGRSRSFINDSPVTVQLLSSISGRLVDIHSQHQSLLLKDRGWQLSLLDFYAGNVDLVSSCRQTWGELMTVRSKLGEAQKRLSSLSADLEYNRSRYERLVAASLREGELEELEEEHRTLSHAEDIKSGLEGVCSLMEPQEGTEVSTVLRDGVRSLERLSSYLPAAGELSERLESVSIEIEDIEDEIRRISDSVDVSPERLEQVESRMSELYSLFKKYGSRTVEELIAQREELGGAVAGTSDLEEEISSLQREEKALVQKHSDICRQLSLRRAGAAPALSQSVQESVRALEMDKAVFSVRTAACEPGINGADEVSFLFSADSGRLEDVSKCVSGGEMSRIMLSLKAIMAEYTAMPTMVFDEIDSGVSGSVADKMGSLICRMGGRMQVFAITHLPQVAAKGTAHYVVSKSEEEGRTRSSISRVSGEDRVKEIARLLSGATVTDAAVANARVLISES